jgi:hypothetical protein
MVFSGHLHYCISPKLLLTSCSPAELVTLHLVVQKSQYFITKKAPFLTTLPFFIAVGLMLIIPVWMIWFFKNRGWF